LLASESFEEQPVSLLPLNNNGDAKNDAVISSDAKRTFKP
jgi:hypothetical protein